MSIDYFTDAIHEALESGLINKTKANQLFEINGVANKAKHEFGDVFNMSWFDLEPQQQLAAIALGMSSMSGADWPRGPRAVEWRQCTRFSSMSIEDQALWSCLGYNEGKWEHWEQRRRLGQKELHLESATSVLLFTHKINYSNIVKGKMEDCGVGGQPLGSPIGHTI